MLNNTLKEKLNKWNEELNEIRERTEQLRDKKIKSNAKIQAALKERNIDEVISAQQDVSRIDEEIEALKLIEAEIKKTHPVDHETFRKEYQIFKEQQRDILNKQYEAILKKLSELEDSYASYESTYQWHVAMLRDWQKLAEEIGLPLPSALSGNIQMHRGLRNDLNRLIRVSKGGTI